MERQQLPQTPPPENQPLTQTRATTGRTRGRPVGSKNKPKPPSALIIKESPNCLNSHILQIPQNYDVVQALMDFSTKLQLGICILNATGSLFNVGLSYGPTQPTLTPAALVMPHVFNYTGRFEILSLNGAILPPPAPPAASGLSVILSNGQGNMIGGKVAGPLLAAETVTVLVSSITGVTYEQFPLVEETPEENKNLTWHDSVGQIQELIPQQTVNAMNPASTTPYLFHDYNPENVTPGEDFWSAMSEDHPPQPF